MPHGNNDSKRKGTATSLPAQPLRDIDSRCVSLLAPDSYESGRYQQLRATLEPEEMTGKGVVVAVTSPSAGDGKTLTAINLAGACAQNPDFRVLIVDVDLRRKRESMGRRFGLSAKSYNGLTDVLHKPDPGHYPAFHLDRHPNLSVLLRGNRNANPYELLASAKFGEFIERARSFYNYVILDAPPILPVPDNSAISRWVDGFVLVVTANRTPRDVLAEAMRTLGEKKMMGLVLNQCEPLAKRYYQYYGKYGDA